MSLTNGPSIMILGRLGVFPTQPLVPDPFTSPAGPATSIPVGVALDFSTRFPHPVSLYSVSQYSVVQYLDTRARSLLGTSRMSVPRNPRWGPRHEGMKRGAAQGNGVSSWRDAESPLPRQVYVTAQVTCG